MIPFKRKSYLETQGFDKFPKGDIGRIDFGEIVLPLSLISGDFSESVFSSVKWE